MNCKIATAPCSWGVWYADGTPSGTPYGIFLDQAAAAGYASLEMGPDGYLPTDEVLLREELACRNLDICAGTACYQFDRYESFDGFRLPIDALCKRLRAFGAPWLVVMDESDVGDHSEKKAAFSPQKWKNFYEMVRDLGRYTKEEYGIEVVYHPHIKSMVETEAEILRLMDDTALRLCFDVGHHAYVNGGTAFDDRSALDFMRRYPEKIAYLHFKNVDARIRLQVEEEKLGSDAAFDMDVMCDLDKGIIDYKALKKTMEDIGFDGIGVIEQDLPKATTQQAFDAATRNLNYLADIGVIQRRG